MFFFSTVAINLNQLVRSLNTSNNKSEYIREQKVNSAKPFNHFIEILSSNAHTCLFFKFMSIERWRYPLSTPVCIPAELLTFIDATRPALKYGLMQANWPGDSSLSQVNASRLKTYLDHLLLQYAGRQKKSYTEICQLGFFFSYTVYSGLFTTAVTEQNRTWLLYFYANRAKGYSRRL